METNSLHSRKSLKVFRTELRKKSTSAEIAFWNMIKNRKIDGRKFRRQHSIGNYIVDFYCPSEKLIIELDGAFHGEYNNINEDVKRDEYLADLGFKVLRFENRFVFQEPEYVLEEIRKHFVNQQTRPK